ncbi:hypothetical protein GCM10010967_12230 [Dyadobacter beijingensis]|uniref:Uncharacterized protein n=1 Tax=Dyadobacter beijingensis TaxID=365489 RepID=A0ABQ2HLF6_9BACT|nr:hypothetical protein [Dyadobacter beijingensis]GGM82079.1 hypothetical protein GCM10010967_12230 [Dyadobacter beijingensis]
MNSKAFGLAAFALISTGGALATLTIVTVAGAIAEFVASNSTFFTGALCGGIFSLVAFSVRKSNKQKHGKN